jgi:hypothetical protein
MNGLFLTITTILLFTVLAFGIKITRDYGRLAKQIIELEHAVKYGLIKKTTSYKKPDRGFLRILKSYWTVAATLLVFLLLVGMVLSFAHSGDVDCDGEVSITDLVLVNRYVLGKEDFSNFQRDCADVNRDGEVTQADVEIISDIILGR